MLQALLDAGADAGMACRFCSTCDRSGNPPELECKIALLVSYGAVDEPALEYT